MRSRSPALVLAGLLASATALAQPDPRPPHGQPPPRSPYADDTGNSDVDRLNAGQLDQNYRGPWHPAVPGHGMMPPDRMEPGIVPPGAGPFGPIPLPPPGRP